MTRTARLCSSVLVGLLVVAQAGQSAASELTAPTTADQRGAISLTGRIVAGDAERFRSLTLPASVFARPVATLTLSSAGGLVSEAVKIAQMVRALGITTLVGDGATCASACFVIFAAGKEKYAENGVRIGIHSAWDPEKEKPAWR